MKRVSNGGRVEVQYEPGDRVRLHSEFDTETVCATVVEGLDNRWIDNPVGLPSMSNEIDRRLQIRSYVVLPLSSNDPVIVPVKAIWKQADTGGMGRIYHLPEIGEWGTFPPEQV